MNWGIWMRLYFPKQGKKCLKCHPSERSRNTEQTSPQETHEKDDPIHLRILLKNNPDDTKWDLALTAHSSLETISPIIHMTHVSGMVSNKGCIMNSLAWWTPHNENTLQSCQACCFNGLISEAIIVNTSQQRRLEHSGIVARSTLVLVAYWLICEGRWVMTRKSEWQSPSLGKGRNIGDIILNETMWWTRTGMATGNSNEEAANGRIFSYIHKDDHCMYDVKSYI